MTQRPALHRFPIVVAFPLLLACHATTDPEPAPTGSARVLFIGNSLTYTNDLPAMVAELGRANGITVSTSSVALGGTALVDHLTMGPAVGEIARGGWSAVVMQQGPTPAGICRDTLVLATRAFATRIRAVGATPATLNVVAHRFASRGLRGGLSVSVRCIHRGTGIVSSGRSGVAERLA